MIYLVIGSQTLASLAENFWFQGVGIGLFEETMQNVIAMHL